MRSTWILAGLLCLAISQPTCQTKSRTRAQRSGKGVLNPLRTPQAVLERMLRAIRAGDVDGLWSTISNNYQDAIVWSFEKLRRMPAARFDKEFGVRKSTVPWSQGAKVLLRLWLASPSAQRFPDRATVTGRQQLGDDLVSLHFDHGEERCTITVKKVASGWRSTALIDCNRGSDPPAQAKRLRLVDYLGKPKRKRGTQKPVPVAPSMPPLPASQKR
jgi:hypothetical protein